MKNGRTASGSVVCIGSSNAVAAPVLRARKNTLMASLQKKENLLKVLSCRCILHASSHLRRSLSFFFSKHLNQAPSPLGKGKRIETSMALAQSCDALATTHRGDRDGASLSRLNRSERATRRGKGDGGEGLIWGRETGAPKTSTQRTPGKARQQGTLTLPLLSLRKAGKITATRQQKAARQVEAHLPVINVSSLLRSRHKFTDAKNASRRPRWRRSRRGGTWASLRTSFFFVCFLVKSVYKYI